LLEAAFAVPGDLHAPTGGYAYARALLDALPGAGVRARHLVLPGSFPDPDAADLAATARRLAAVPAERPLLVDGLAYGALPPDLLRGVAAPLVALVHHPLALEAGLSPARRAALAVSEQAALALARGVVATSAHTARLLAAEYGVPADGITVAEPGTEPAARARGSGTGAGRPVSLVALGAVTPRKAYPLLARALAAVPGDWRLTIVGSLERDPDEAERLRAAVEGLDGRVVLAGAVDDEARDALLDAADVLVSASLLEGYGMALAEGLARGLPVVASTGGAAGETVPEGCGLPVPPGDEGALAAALARMVAEPALRRRCADAAWAAGQRLPRWHGTAERVAAALRAVA
jgi:glycosyltransferase involved in cell wall biosynthesis